MSFRVFVIIIIALILMIYNMALNCETNTEKIFVFKETLLSYDSTNYVTVSPKESIFFRSFL